jgi:hypothetical protein
MDGNNRIGQAPHVQLEFVMDHAFKLCERHIISRILEQLNVLGRKRPTFGKLKNPALEKFCRAKLVRSG